VCHNLGMKPSPPNRASRRQGVRWGLLVLGVGGLLYGAGAALLGHYLPVGVIGGGVVLVVLGLGLVQRPPNLTWTRRKALAALVAFAVLGIGLIGAGVASLAGLLGPTQPGGFRTNDFAALAICFGAVALVFAYASYRSMNRTQ
jgi:hypothetical protein